MYHPACWIVFTATTALIFFPGVPVRSGDATFPKAMDNVTVRQGESAILRCTVDNRVTRVAWLNRSTILYAGKDKWSLDDRVVIASNTRTEYSIKIFNVDIYDEGPYTCSVQTDNHPKTSRVHLIVQVPPQIINISRDITVNEGSSVTLLCLAFGRPEPTVTWRHLSSKGREFLSEDEYLEITGITRYQSGEYECSAANEVAVPDIRRVKVTVNYPPSISNAKNTGASVGQKGILRCEASAVPVAEFQWFKEETRLANGLDGVRIENKGRMSTLTFFNVSEKDYGNYTCVAINKLGNTNASIILYDRQSWQYRQLLLEEEAQEMKAEEERRAAEQQEGQEAEGEVLEVAGEDPQESRKRRDPAMGSPSTEAGPSRVEGTSRDSVALSSHFPPPTIQPKWESATETGATLREEMVQFEARLNQALSLSKTRLDNIQVGYQRMQQKFQQLTRRVRALEEHLLGDQPTEPPTSGAFD